MAGRPQRIEQVMESTTRFDLDAAIRNWRVELAGQPGMSWDAARELETHLRESVAELTGRGLNAEESFWLARRRIGPPRQLGEEFGKAAPELVWRDRALWIAITMLGFEALNMLIRFPLETLFIHGNYESWRVYGNAITGRLINIGLVLGVLALLSRGASTFPSRCFQFFLDSPAMRRTIRWGLGLLLVLLMGFSLVGSLVSETPKLSGQYSVTLMLGLTLLMPFTLLCFVERQLGSLSQSGASSTKK